MFQVDTLRALREVRVCYGDDAQITAGSLLEMKWWLDCAELFTRPDVAAMLHGDWRRHGCAWFRAGDLCDWFDARKRAE